MLSIPTTHLFFLLMFIYLRGWGDPSAFHVLPFEHFSSMWASLSLFYQCVFILILSFLAYIKNFPQMTGYANGKRLCNVDLVRLVHYFYCCIEYLKLAFGMRQVLSKFSLLFESQSVVGIFEERLSSMSYMFNWHFLKSNTFFIDCCF